MINEIDIFVHAHPWAFALICLVLGAAIGSQLNYLRALQLARRKEFVDLSSPALLALHAQIEALKNGAHGMGYTNFLLIELYVPLHRRWLFRRRLRSYIAANKYAPAYNVNYGTVEHNAESLDCIARAAQKLLPYLRRR